MSRDPHRVDLSPLVGTWVNTHSDTEWIDRFVIEPDGDGFTIRVTARQQPTDWGARPVLGYGDNIGEMAFHAFFDLGSLDAHLAANTNKGLVVIAAFLNFKDDSGRKNFLCREFYYRPAEVWRRPEARG